MNNFDVKRVNLSGANLIEASAGTGKTFSIAVLVVRLIIENKITVSKMLLVTFTEAAAAELKERSIKFIREAIEEFESPGDSGNSILQAIIQEFDGDRDAAKERLYDALLEIDQAMMCTIHSFCQQTLNEFAFETKQAYGKELITDLSEISSKYREAFIREELSSLPTALLDIVFPIFNALSGNIIDNYLGGKRYVPSTDGDLDLDACLQEFVNYEEFKSTLINESKLVEMREIVINSTNKNVIKAQQSYLDKLSTVENVISALEKNDPKTFNKLFPEISEELLNRFEIIQVFRNQLKDWLIIKFIDWISDKIETTLKKKNLFTFDDLINQLYQVRTSVRLKEILREKYDAIFVDEFQDTDQKQYDIFYHFFQEDKKKVLFYIGDPKQSIYSWRKADLNTYYQARNSIFPRKRFDMKVNFRSSKQLVQALNHFFQPFEGFNTFENEIGALNRIDYIQVTSNKVDEKGLIQDGQELSPIRIINNHGNKTEIYRTIEASIKFLFFGGLKLNDQKVKPSNVCVLTRTNKQSKAVKDILNKLAIPSVISDDSKVINSHEAKELLFLLEAILTPQKSSIQKVLLTQFMNYSVYDFKNLDFDYYIELFTLYGKTWAKDGVYVALNALLTEFDIIQKLQKKGIAGQRVISNLKQLIELLQEKELRNSFTPNETYLFLQNQIKSTSDAEVSEYAQRLENDEDTVKIVTIHKSKGMEYDIVIAPFLDFDESEMFDLSSIRLQTNNQENNYIFVTNPIVNATHKTLYASQQKQENRRLIYVALTRAKYNLIIINKSHKNIKGGGKSEITHALTDFVKAIKLSPSNIQIIDKEDIEQVDLGKLDLDDDQLQPIQKPLPELLFPDSNYKKMSYSYLAAHPAKGAKEQLADYDKNSYEYFVFKDLPKGANIGNMLHDIFEFIDYTDNSKWREIIEKLVIRYIPVYKDKPLFLENIFELVKQTLNANISIALNTFQLSNLSRDYRKNEFEFNFAIPNDFNISELENVLDDETRKIQTNYNKVKGMMTGFIDLFFEYDNKYYILDWKSNFLGDTLSDYDREGVAQAMNESNYHLQYLIYALALEKYLKSKLPNFDFEKQFGGVIYLFLRGNREGEQTGVFTQTVEKEELTKLKNVFQIY